MSELLSNERKNALRKILDRLHAGESSEALKEEFKELLGEVTPLEISKTARGTDKLVRRTHGHVQGVALQRAGPPRLASGAHPVGGAPGNAGSFRPDLEARPRWIWR